MCLPGHINAKGESGDQEWELGADGDNPEKTDDKPCCLPQKGCRPRLPCLLWLRTAG